MQVQEFDWSKPQRPSPVALLFVFGKIIRETWLVILFLVGRKLFRNEKDPEKSALGVGYYLLGMLAVLLVIRIHYIIQHFRFRFFIESDQLVISTGVLTKKIVTIPLGRIQSVHLKQTYLHRLTNTYGLALETAGSSDAELEIAAIREDVALQFQAFLLHKKVHESTTVINEHPQLITIRNVDLLKLAISENHVKTFLLIIAFAMSRLDDLQKIVGIDAQKEVEKQVDGVRFTFDLIILLVGSGLFLTLMVSFFRTLFRFRNWKMSLTDKGFQLHWGFLQTQQKMLLHRNVQLVSWNSNFVRSFLGTSMFRFLAAGENIANDTHWIRVPVLQKRLLSNLTHFYRPVGLYTEKSPNSVDSAYGWRPTLIYLLPLTLLSTGVIFSLDDRFIVIPIMLFLYLTVSNFIRQRRFRFWFDAEGIYVRKGIWGTQELLLRYDKVQQVSVSSSPYLRSRKLATLVFHAAGDSVKIPYIPTVLANYLADLCLSKIK